MPRSKAPAASDEQQRLEALRRYDILDTPAEDSYDDVTRLAAAICDTPIALITLVDEHRQWFKSRVGLDVGETARDIAFCSRCIENPGVMQVSDAAGDERFRNNPLVTGPPHIGFYAGAPLVTPDGFRIGTVCVIDRKQRQITELQAEALETLAQQVITNLELRRALKLAEQTSTALTAEAEIRTAAEEARRQSDLFMRATIDSLPDNIAIVDRGGTIVHVNLAWSRFAEENSPAELIADTGPGINYLEVCDRAAGDGSSGASEVARAMRQTLGDGASNGFSLEYPCHSPQRHRWCVVQISAFGSGEDRYAVVTHRDVTRRRKATEEVIALNRELEGRVAQRTADLERANRTLRTAEQTLRTSESQLRALTKRLERIREDERVSISREIHDELGQMLTALKIDLTLLARDVGDERRGPPSPAEVRRQLQSMEQLVDSTISSVRSIAMQLRPELLDAFGLVAAIEWHATEFEQRTNIHCIIDTQGSQPELTPDQRTALFRIVQEAMTNVARHAHADLIKISIRDGGDSVDLTITDNGRGVSDAELAGGGSLGVLGMRERAAMVGASFDIRGAAGRGTVVSVRLPHGEAQSETAGSGRA